MNNPIESIITIKDKLLYFLYQAELSDVVWWRRPWVYLLRMLFATLRDLSDGQLNMRAMSLVYTTLLALVPLLAISFSVLKGFGARGQMEPFLLNLLTPLGQGRYEITEKVIGFVDNIEVGILGAFGLAILFYTVISLMTKIERAFNYTWNVTESRRFTARFSDYLSVLLVGPFLIFVSVGITASISNDEFLASFNNGSPLGVTFEVLALVIPYILMTIAFAFIYIFMPNTRVRLLPALTGGAVTTVMWKILGYLFKLIVAGSASYSAIYSAFATLIIFMIWLYSGWLVLLIGAGIAYYVQNPSNLTISRDTLTISNEMHEYLSLSILGRVALSYYEDNNMGWTVSNLADALKLPIRVIERNIETLERQGLVLEQRDRPYALMPAQPFEVLTIAEALKAIRSADGKKNFISSRARQEQRTQDLLVDIDALFEKEFGKLTLKDWVLKKQPKTGDINIPVAAVKKAIKKKAPKKKKPKKVIKAKSKK